jgi:hypothetical protein
MNVTNSNWIPGAGAPLKPSHATTPYDDLPVPGGKKLGDLSRADFNRVIIDECSIPGTSHSQGREENAKAYAVFLDRMKGEAATHAVNTWLARKQ